MITKNFKNKSTKNYHVITLFPDFVEAVLEKGMIKRAKNAEIFRVDLCDLRDYGKGRYRSVDSPPCGGGGGMLLKADVLECCLKEKKISDFYTVSFSPRGKKINQDIIQNLNQYRDINFICGQYEGIDQRFISKHIDLELSLGDFVINSGEMAFFVLLEAMIRLLPGFMNNENVPKHESFGNEDLGRRLEHDQFTKPHYWNNHQIPDVLLSGNQKEIMLWKSINSYYNTLFLREKLFLSCEIKKNVGLGLLDIFSKTSP